MRARKVTVTTSPTLIASGGATVSPDDAVLYVPTEGATVYIGDAAVTTATGFPVAAGGEFTWPLRGDSIYGIVAASTQAIHVAERGD